MPFRKTERRAATVIARAVKELLADYDTASPAMKKFIDLTLRKMCSNLEWFVEIRVSRAAAERAKPIDLRMIGWGQQLSQLKDHGRKIYHWEHVVPASQIAKKLVENRKASLRTLERIIQEAEVAWILKSEDQALTKLGMRSDRPFSAYQQAGIELL